MWKNDTDEINGLYSTAQNYSHWQLYYHLQRRSS